MKIFLEWLYKNSFSNFFVVGLIILLITLSISAIRLKDNIHSILNDNIYGTFITPIGENKEIFPIENNQYFVFQKDGKFYRYIQSEILNKGKFEKIQDNIYVIDGSNKRENVLYFNSNLYYYDEEIKEYLKFTKISDTPIFVRNEDVSFDD